MPVIHQSSSQQPHYQTADFNLADAALGLGALVSFVAFVGGIIATGTLLNGFLGPALLAVVGIAAQVALDKAGKFKTAAHRLLQASLFIGLWGFIAVAAHWVPYLWVAGASIGLFVASLVAGTFAALSKLWKALAALFAICAVTAVVVLPAPKGTEDPEEESNKWRVEVSVVDADGQPVEGATVRVAVVMAWETGGNLSVDEPAKTDKDGRISERTFTEDPKLKAVIVEADKAAGPANAEYPSAREIALKVTRGSRVSVKITLKEAAHPDTAFLKLDATVKPHAQWYYLHFQLWDGPPQGVFMRGDTHPRLLQQTSWGEMTERSLVVGRELAGKDLYLRHYYESGPERETVTTHVGPISAGARTYLKLKVPGQPGAD